MVNKVLMPRMGSSMEEGTILHWLKKEGDQVEKGDMIAEIETEKVTIQIEAFASGILRKIVAPEGATVPVGGLIAVIAGADEALPPIEQLTAGAPPPPAPVEKPAPQAAPAPIPTVPIHPPGERIAASPVARRMAENYHIDLAQVRGTGPGGRIVKEDIEQFAAQRQAAITPPVPTPTLPEAAAEGVERVPLTKIRQAIATHLTKSKQTVPHYYVTMEIDVTEAQKIREELNELGNGESRISVNDVIIAATARALKKFPEVNASLEGNVILRKHFVNIGIAIDTEDGLIVPVLHDTDKMTLREIARESKRLAQGARQRHLAEKEVEGATFTISNLGMFGVDEFLAVINPPESGILAVGAVEKKPVVIEDQVVIAQRVKVSLSGDHRVIDGAAGARFLQELKRLLEKPLSLLA